MAKGKKKKSKKRGCSAVTATKLYVVENRGKLSVTRCKSRAKKIMTTCRKKAKKAGRGACQMHTVKAKKIRVKRGAGRIRRR